MGERWIQDEDNPRCVGTPKPWYPSQVYDVVTVLEGGPECTDEANAKAETRARLIASAPTMLEALQAAAVTIRAALPIAEEAGYDDNSAAERTLEQVRAAIRAATGEP